LLDCSNNRTDYTLVKFVILFIFIVFFISLFSYLKLIIIILYFFNLYCHFNSLFIFSLLTKLSLSLQSFIFNTQKELNATYHDNTPLFYRLIYILFLNLSAQKDPQLYQLHLENIYKRLKTIYISSMYPKLHSMLHKMHQELIDPNNYTYLKQIIWYNHTYLNLKIYLELFSLLGKNNQIF